MSQAESTTKKCLQCGEEKKLTQYYKTKKEGYSKICRSCTQKNKYNVVATGKEKYLKAKRTPANIDAVCQKVLGRYVKQPTLTGNEMLLQILLEFAMKEASKREKKDILMFLANKLNPNAKETKVIEQKITIDKEVSEAVEDLICDLKVIDGGRK
jgi:hypothetical protein